MLGKSGDYILIEEHCYPTLFETGFPMGYQCAQVKMDKEGLVPEDLDNVLSNWDEAARKGPKPRLLYTVPTGQNPSGATPLVFRRQEVYRIAQKHDLYIVEDDPYYFIQLPEYRSAGQRDHIVRDGASVEEFARRLIPSYLSLDVDGRVFRMDSFSKIIAPGARTGWVTASEQVVERMIRAHEVSTQNPSGFSQIVLFKLLHDTWGHQGLVKWLEHLQSEYTRRRDTIFDACERYLPRDIVDWVPPRAGFFVCIRFLNSLFDSKNWLTLDNSRPGSQLIGANIHRQHPNLHWRSRRKSMMLRSTPAPSSFLGAGSCPMKDEAGWMKFSSA